MQHQVTETRGGLIYENDTRVHFCGICPECETTIISLHVTEPNLTNKEKGIVDSFITKVNDRLITRSELIEETTVLGIPQSIVETYLDSQGITTEAKAV